MFVNREYLKYSKEYQKVSIMFTVENTFSTWLDQQLRRRNMNRSQLAQLAGLSKGTISNITTGTRGIGIDTCQAIAKALRIPEEEVLRAAGLLNKTNPRDERIERILMRIEELEPADQEVIDALIETLLERRRGKNAATPQEAPSTT